MWLNCLVDTQGVKRTENVFKGHVYSTSLQIHMPAQSNANIDKRMLSKYQQALVDWFYWGLSWLETLERYERCVDTIGVY